MDDQARLIFLPVPSSPSRVASDPKHQVKECLHVFFQVWMREGE